jgi:Ulp1 family protease
MFTYVDPFLLDASISPATAEKEMARCRGKSTETESHRKQCTNDTKGFVSQVQNTLACISWAGDIKGFSASISTVHLTTYLTCEWFTDEHENQMLYLLQQEVSRVRREDGISVCNTFFMKRLINLQQDEDGPNHYATGANYAWLREKGQELATGDLDMLVMIANIGSNHWVAIVVDFKSSNILYGDSMGGTIDNEIEKALTWWIHHHTRKHFTKCYLPITHQRDGHSCGILAWAALAHFLFPGTYLLVDAGLLTNKRLRMFIQVSDHHNEKVSKDYNSQSFVINEKVF